MKRMPDSTPPFKNANCLLGRHGGTLTQGFCQGIVVIRRGGKPAAVACECECHPNE